MRSSDETLIAALEILSNDIQSDDGVANAVVAEAALRIRELTDKIDDQLDAMH
jgi:hypothetical protein